MPSSKYSVLVHNKIQISIRGIARKKGFQRRDFSPRVHLIWKLKTLWKLSPGLIIKMFAENADTQFIFPPQSRRYPFETTQIIKNECKKNEGETYIFMQNIRFTFQRAVILEKIIIGGHLKRPNGFRILSELASTRKKNLPAVYPQIF